MDNQEVEKKVNDKESEQWLLNGNCSICRKRKYCNKDCSARIKAFEKKVSNSIGSIFLKRMLR